MSKKFLIGVCSLGVALGSGRQRSTGRPAKGASRFRRESREAPSQYDLKVSEVAGKLSLTRK